VLSQSGHMQAILNPPGNPKAKYFVSKKAGLPPGLPLGDVEQWLQGSEEVAGSWWPRWVEWIQMRAGAKVTAPAALGSGKYPPQEAAPGLYVLDQA